MCDTIYQGAFSILESYGGVSYVHDHEERSFAFFINMPEGVIKICPVRLSFDKFFCLSLNSLFCSSLEREIALAGFLCTDVSMERGVQLSTVHPFNYFSISDVRVSLWDRCIL